MCIYVIMKTICSPGYHHNGFVATHILGHMIYSYTLLGPMNQKFWFDHQCIKLNQNLPKKQKQGTKILGTKDHDRLFILSLCNIKVKVNRWSSNISAQST